MGRKRMLIREARSDDLAAASRCHADAFNHLNLRHGYPEQRYSRSTVNAYFRFALGEPATGFWVAEMANRVCGIAVASVSDRTWLLSHLFVHPRAQGRGLGRALLEHAVQDDRASHATHHVLMTMAYNPVSLSLYADYGFVPGAMVYRVQRDLRPSTAVSPARCAGEPPAASTPDGISALSALDEHVMGRHRDSLHQFYASSPDALCLTAGSTGDLDAYAYLWRDGRVGPAAATSRPALQSILGTCASKAEQMGIRTLSTFVSPQDPGSFDAILRWQMRIMLPFVMMSRHPMRPATDYLYHSPGLM